MNYFKRRWDEDPGGDKAHWGESDWYFETDLDGNVLRQIEVFVSGPTLFYDQEYLEDAYGGLSEKPLDLEEFKDFAITQDAFNDKWGTLQPENRK